MIKYFHLFFLTLILFVVSCGKKDVAKNVTVSGNVRNNCTGVGFAGVKVKFTTRHEKSFGKKMDTCIQDQVKEKVLDNSLDCCCKPEYISDAKGFTYSEDVDVFVIGAGISGLYLGYQALQIPTTKKIVIVEKANRVGGRLTSTPIPDTIPPEYYAEGCAQRFFLASDPKVVQLLNNLGIGYVAKPNSNIQTPTTYSNILDTLVSNFSPTASNTSELSFPDAVLLSLSGGNNLTYNDLDAFCDTLGYPVFRYPINLNMSYKSIFKFTGPVQQLIIGGYKNVCETMYNQISPQIPVILNYQVKNICIILKEKVLMVLMC